MLNPRSLKWTWKTALLGAIGGWVLLLLVFAPGRICWPQPSARCALHAWNYLGDLIWLRYLDHWQTLAAGLIAILAALIGGHFINKQIYQTAQLEAARQAIEVDREAREFDAVHAMLSLYLDVLAEYVLECAAALRTIYRMRRGTASATIVDAPEIPPAPKDVAIYFQSVILRSPANLRQPFVDILQKLQVLNARLRSLRRRYNSGRANLSEFDDYALDVMDLHSTVIALFPFARDKNNDQPNQGMIAGQYLSSLTALELDDNEFPGLRQKAANIVVASSGTPGASSESTNSNDAPSAPSDTA